MKRVLLLLCVLIYSSCLAMPPAPEPFLQPALNMYVTCEIVDPDKAVIFDIQQAVDEGIPCIISSSLITAICTHYYDKIEKSIEEANRWSAFFNADEDFVVLLPRKYSPGLLKEYGFSTVEIAGSPYLRHIENKMFRSTFYDKDLYSHHKPQRYEKRPVFISNFKKLFDSTRNIPKRIYMDGHGEEPETDKPARIAGMNIEDFIRFLSILMVLNTEFLYIITCYASGINTIAVQEQITRQQERTPFSSISSKINFPIVFQATTDATTFNPLYKPRFGSFFRVLDKWLAESHLFMGKPKMGLRLSDVLKTLYDIMPDVFRLPSVRLPGTNSFFRAAEVDKMLVVTYIWFQKYLRESGQLPLLPQGRTFKLVEKPVPFLVSPEIQYILLYPCNLLGLSLSIGRTEKGPIFISKIPGPAQHFIKELNCPQLTPIELLNEFLLEATVQTYGGRPMPRAPKAWFIEHVLCKGMEMFGLGIYNVKNTLSLIYTELPVANPASAVWKVAQLESGSGKLLSSSLPNDLPSYYVYSLILKNMQASTLPSDAALKESTGGNENQQSAKESFNTFLNDLHVSIPTVAEQELFIANKMIETGDKLLKEQALIATERISKQISAIDLIKNIGQLINDQKAGQSPLIGKMITVALDRKLEAQLAQLADQIQAGRSKPVLLYYKAALYLTLKEYNKAIQPLGLLLSNDQYSSYAMGKLKELYEKGFQTEVMKQIEKVRLIDDPIAQKSYSDFMQWVLPHLPGKTTDKLLKLLQSESQKDVELGLKMAGALPLDDYFAVAIQLIKDKAKNRQVLGFTLLEKIVLFQVLYSITGDQLASWMRLGNGAFDILIKKIEREITSNDPSGALALYKLLKGASADERKKIYALFADKKELLKKLLRDYADYEAIREIDQSYFKWIY